MDAQVIVKVACHMMAKYHDDAAWRAERRAMDLEDQEPAAAADWHLVAEAIGVLSKSSSRASC